MSGTLETTYVHSPVRQIGTVLATSSGSTASSGTFAYYFQDAIGSTRGLWDNSGDRLGKYDYTPFGGKYSEHGEDITRKFTGHDWDSETRLYYTAYRYYSPDSNRWLTRDPLGMVAGPNVYAYVVNNPVSFWDALGLYSTTMESMSVGGIGAMLGQFAARALYYLSSIGAGITGYQVLEMGKSRRGNKAGERQTDDWTQEEIDKMDQFPRGLNESAGEWAKRLFGNSKLKLRHFKKGVEGKDKNLRNRTYGTRSFFLHTYDDELDDFLWGDSEGGRCSIE